MDGAVFGGGGVRDGLAACLPGGVEGWVAVVGLVAGSAAAALGCEPVEDAGVFAARAAVADAAAGAGWWAGCSFVVAVGDGWCCAVVDGSVGFSCTVGETAAGTASAGTAAWWCAATVGGGDVFFRFPGVSCTAGSSVGGVGSVVASFSGSAVGADALAGAGAGADRVFFGVGCSSALAVVVADGSQSVRAAHPNFAACLSGGVGDGAAAVVVGFAGAGWVFVLAVVGADGVVTGGVWSPTVGGTRARLLFFRPLIITREL